MGLHSAQVSSSSLHPSSSVHTKRAWGHYPVQTPISSGASTGLRPISPNPFQVFRRGQEGEVHLACYVWNGVYLMGQGPNPLYSLILSKSNVFKQSSYKLAWGWIYLKQFHQFTVKGLFYLNTSKPSFGPTAIQLWSRFSSSHYLDAGPGPCLRCFVPSEMGRWLMDLFKLLCNSRKMYHFCLGST